MFHKRSNTLFLQVTAQTIQEACTKLQKPSVDRSENCPVALTLKNAEAKEIMVGYDRIYFKYQDKNYRLSVSESLYQSLYDFDHFGEMKELNFKLNLSKNQY